jgi:DNA-binding NtrC family response regulator
MQSGQDFEPQAGGRTAGQPDTILIIANSDLMRRMLEEVVRRIGWRNQAIRLESHGAARGLDYFHAHSAAILCVVFDVDEPEAAALRAYSVLRAIRQQLPVIFLSDFGSSLAGIPHHDPLVVEIEKPFRLTSLRESLWRLLGPQFITRLSP